MHICWIPQWIKFLLYYYICTLITYFKSVLNVSSFWSFWKIFDQVLSHFTRHCWCYLWGHMKFSLAFVQSLCIFLCVTWSVGVISIGLTHGCLLACRNSTCNCSSKKREKQGMSKVNMNFPLVANCLWTSSPLRLKVRAITELRSGLATGHTVTQLFICCIQCHINFMNFYPRNLSPQVLGFNIFAIEVERGH